MRFVVCRGVDEDIVSCCNLFNKEPFIVIAADCLYWESLFVPFLNTLCAVTELGGIVILSYVKRWKKGNKFFAMCKRKLSVEMTYEQIDVDASEPGVNNNPIRDQVSRIYVIRKKP